MDENELGQLLGLGEFSSRKSYYPELQKKIEELEDEVQRRRESEERIKESLMEKEILLREIHHRVKNNMTVISSLLNLKCTALEEDETKQPLLDSIQRIETMASIHEYLYANEKIKSINIKDYLMDFISDLILTFKPEGLEIEKELDIDEIEFDLDTLIPIGLITNEIITNILKHAFNREMDHPKIMISMKHLETEQVVYKISDNGLGIDFDKVMEKKEAIGFTITRALVDQIAGELTINSKLGIETIFTITFPIN